MICNCATDVRITVFVDFIQHCPVALIDTPTQLDQFVMLHNFAPQQISVVTKRHPNIILGTVKFLASEFIYNRKHLSVAHGKI